MQKEFLKLELSEGKSSLTIDELAETLQVVLAATMTVELNNQISIGNDKFVVIVDGKLAPATPASFASVKRRIVIDFILSAAEIAIAEMKRIFSAAIRGYVVDANAPYALKTKLGSAVGSQLSGLIRVFYGKENGQVTEVSSAGEVKTFEYGDFLMLTPDLPLGWLANSPLLRTKKPSSRSNVGYFGVAARRIRRKLRGSRRTTSIRVQAGFSKRVGGFVGNTEANSGKAAMRYGHPVIYIRVREPKSASRGF